MKTIAWLIQVFEHEKKIELTREKKKKKKKKSEHEDNCPTYIQEQKQKHRVNYGS